MRAAAPSVDLFAWREEADARAALEAAEEHRERAKARYRTAPHGEVRNRLTRLQEATEASLRAGLEVAQAARKGLH